MPSLLSTLSTRCLAQLACLGLLLVFPADSYALIGILSEAISDPSLHISDSDLVNADAESLASVSSTPFTAIGAVNDGAASVSLVSEDDGEYPATIIFNLNTAEHSLGYSLTHLTTVTGVGDSHSPDWPDPSETADQRYSVAYSLVGDPAYIDFATVGAVSAGTHQKVTLTSLAGDVPIGVDSLRFTWMDPLPTLGPEFRAGDTYTAIVEIDVFGSPVIPVPEPASVGLLLLSVAVLSKRVRT